MDYLMQIGEGVLLAGQLAALFSGRWILAGGLGLLVLLGGFLWMRRIVQVRTARYRAVFEHLPAPALLLSEDFRVMGANEAAARLRGRPLDQKGRRHIRSLVDFDKEVDWETFPETIEAAGEAVTCEGHFERRDGTKVLLKVAIGAAEGRTSPHYLAVLHDVTAEEEQSALFRNFHRQILHDLPIEVAVLSPQGQYVYANPRVAKGAEAQGWLKQKTDVDYGQKLGLHPEVSLRRRSHRKRAIGTEKRVRFEEALALPDGTSRHFDRYYAPIFDQKGSVYAVASYGVELTTLKRQEAEVVEAREKGEDYERCKKTFLQNMSHEFRTPLTGIIGITEVLQQEISDEHREFVDLIEENGRRLMSTLNALLDLAGLDADDREMDLELLDVVHHAREVVNDLHEEAEEKVLFLRVKAEASEVFSRLDQTSFYRVMRSLLSNAIKFTDTGGIVVEVEREGDLVEVRVIDTGIGIEEGFLPYLFDEFQQESSGLQRDYGGTGLGLTVVKRMVDAVGGAISVDSAKEEGSTFTVSLPVVFGGKEEAGSAAPHLLVVESAVESQKLFRHLLEPYFEVEVAGSMEELQERPMDPCDVVLLNVHLDETLEEAALLEGMRCIEGLKEVPAIAVETVAGSGRREVYLASGYDRYLKNPFDKRTLLNAISEALNHPVPVGELAVV